ncbi:MAG: hypothetical protein K6G76_11770 [Lachnospiraceae bacterium]|nr:hypothetical protein [Lachnospiraceae bacterium]
MKNESATNRILTIKYSLRDIAVLAFFRCFSFLSVSSRTRAKHFDINEREWESYTKKHPNDKYIEQQNAMKDLYYGRRYRADYNSCELIALYNALVALKDTSLINNSFPSLIQAFEKKGITCGGAFGTSPYEIIHFLKSAGYKVTCVRYRKYNKVFQNIGDMYDTFILVTYNNALTVKDMIHTMCITKEDGQYHIHNDYEGNKTYSSLSDAVSGYKNGKSRMIMLICVSKDC